MSGPTIEELFHKACNMWRNIVRELDDGPALSVAVAREVMGLGDAFADYWKRPLSIYFVDGALWKPHEDANQALQVVCAISDKHPNWAFWVEEENEDGQGTRRYWRCGWSRPRSTSLLAEGPTLPLAICRAALVVARGQGVLQEVRV